MAHSASAAGKAMKLVQNYQDEAFQVAVGSVEQSEPDFALGA